MSVTETKMQTGEPVAKKTSSRGLALIVFVRGAGVATLGWTGFLTWIVLAFAGF